MDIPSKYVPITGQLLVVVQSESFTAPSGSLKTQNSCK